MYNVYVKDGESFPRVSQHLTLEEAVAAFQSGGRIEQNDDDVWIIVMDDSQN